ncbi:helix-hairpin-helix domain-containing protein, partial [Accumulibacter sp.]
MPKIITLLLALLMVTLNVFAGVNVNTANEKELQMLTGIGPAKAKAIIDFRTKNGEFKAVDDLLKVPGIGPAVLGKMRSDVTLSGATTGKASAAPAAPAAKTAPPAAAPSTPAAAGAAAAPAKPASPA